MEKEIIYEGMVDALDAVRSQLLESLDT